MWWEDASAPAVMFSSSPMQNAPPSGRGSTSAAEPVCDKWPQAIGLPPPPPAAAVGVAAGWGEGARPEELEAKTPLLEGLQPQDVPQLLRQAGPWVLCCGLCRPALQRLPQQWLLQHPAGGNGSEELGHRAGGAEGLQPGQPGRGHALRAVPEERRVQEVLAACRAQRCRGEGLFAPDLRSQPRDHPRDLIQSCGGDRRLHRRSGSGDRGVGGQALEDALRLPFASQTLRRSGRCIQEALHCA
eukprot:CAMPEP_0175619090 /NCGR_PEP_ID=MMETSP0096-20121207/67233_1 /TAXON_ID=311494 /ORGANISM="Alexandrium monilatum, Strain CCMP3105" /LENGTH=242 /DNA_ID=CAMNT_0016924303 /DNA_START=73 /DNA_END=796 /DNA_ORIENTATION=+